MVSQPLKMFSREWSIPFMLFFFNVADTIGRTATSYILLVTPERMFVASIARFIFILSFCLIGHRVSDSYFVHDWWIILNIILFGITNGYLCSLAMIYGPQDEYFKEEERESAGKMMAFYLTAGIFIGSLLAQAIMSQVVVT